MKINVLRYIVEVNNSGSISKTAEKLHVSQPTVSQDIAKFEKSINIKIFNRSKIGTKPTNTGKIIIKKAYEILNKIDEFNYSVQTHNSILDTNLNLVTIPSLSTALLPRTLNAFKNKYPNVQIKIFETGTLQAIDYFETYKIDFGLLSRQSNSDYNSNYNFNTLLEGQIKACVHKHHPLAKEGFISIKQISDFPIVILNPLEYRMHSYILKLLEEITQPNILMTANNPESLKRVIVEEDMVVGFFSDVALINDPLVKSGDLITLNILNQNMRTDFGIVHPKNKQMSPASLEFIRELELQALYLQNNYIW